MSNFHTHGSNNEPTGNNNNFANRREMRANNVTGALPIISSGRNYSSSFNFEVMIASLHDLFEHDRQLSSQPDARRCGICYLHFFQNELTYREEGYYVCESCEGSLGKQMISMLRKQQK